MSLLERMRRYVWHELAKRAAKARITRAIGLEAAFEPASPSTP
jgi:hypothetical protein